MTSSSFLIFPEAISLYTGFKSFFHDSSSTIPLHPTHNPFNSSPLLAALISLYPHFHRTYSYFRLLLQYFFLYMDNSERSIVGNYKTATVSASKIMRNRS